MSKCFIVATSYYARMVLYLSDYLFINSDFEFFLLSENHMFSDIKDDRIRLYNHMETAIRDSNYIWLIDTELRTELCEKIITLTCKYHKQLIITEIKSENSFVNNTTYAKTMLNKPSILSIGLGDSSQQYCTEILLNQMLNNTGAFLYHNPSPITQRIVDSLMKFNLINERIVRSLNENMENVDVCLKGISVRSYNELMTHIKEAEAWNVDIIVINVNKNIAQNIGILNKIKSSVHQPVYFVCSEYIEVENNMPKTLYIKTNENLGLPMINNECDMIKMMDTIIANISYPKYSYKVV